ncbi:helix-turn-helix domain-containing protein [Streptomyces sp. NBC_01198]|uniref:helix-turn-helix domain-containing protein n=1 Tax=Streptomyces sp. NBC_01198 TaxID=2903769 RepID=UPI002E151EB2|nr:helix-turn-helix transcriptional regulator [Streptomyces sp. NBC_01198]
MAERKPSSAKKLDPAQSPRAMYGAELRYQRERAGLSQAALGEKLFVGHSLIAKMESGERRVQPDMAEQLDRVLDAGGFFVRNMAAARATPYPEHFADVVELEADTTGIRQWEPLLVPGLLQTEAYAMAVIRAYDPVLAHELVQERLAARLVRARIFDSATRPLYWAIVDEAAIRCPVGGQAVMAAQLRHVAAMIHRNRIIFQVLPFSAGAHPGMDGPLKLMAFEDDAPMAYLPGAETGMLVDDPATVKRLSLAYDLLGAAALPPEASLTFIEAVAEEYEHGPEVQAGGGHMA